MTLWFDCDGTWIDLYGVDGWLTDLQNYNPRPYIVAKPLINLSTFAKYLHKLQKKGYKIGIISWLAKNSNEEYDNLVKEAKLNWLQKHLPSVKWDSINIVPYGTPKHTIGSGILFDDEKQNRDAWIGISYDEKNIFEVLKTL